MKQQTIRSNPSVYPVGALVRNIENPEMGPGRLRGHSNDRLLVRFSWRFADAQFDSQYAPLERYRLFGGTPVQCRIKGVADPVEGLVLGLGPAKAEDGILSYRIGTWIDNGVQESVVPETALFPLAPTSNAPLEHFKALMWNEPNRFLQRWRMRLLESRWLEDSGGIPALLGARIQPMGHQIYAVRRILWDRVPRFILADEVGLGKTIEAGLAIQTLMAEKPSLRVLVIAPGSMARQWQTELYLRFGALAYRYLDSACLSVLSSVQRCNYFDSPHLIIATTALQTHPEVRDELLARTWDLVVIDEAHQFPPGDELYEFFHRLAQRSYGLLALSATPSKREISSLAGLLALVAPAMYKPDDRKALSHRIEIQRGVWDRLSFTRKYLDSAENAGERLEADDLAYLAGEWDGLLPGDPVVASLLDQLRAGELRAADELTAYVQEFHRLDHRIIRTRRSALERESQHWAARVTQIYRYEPQPIEAVLTNHLDELPWADNLDATQRALRGLYFRKFATTPENLLQFLEARRRAIDSAPAGWVGPDPLGLLTGDPGPADEVIIIKQIIEHARSLPGEVRWLDAALGLARDWQSQVPLPARIQTTCDWLRSHLGESPKNQVLIFAQDHEVVEQLTEILSGVLPDHPIKCFHHLMDEQELAQAALSFQQNKHCRVLISDELGGEGRNFQNATALVHFDLPWSVARMEQRIGRLDRVARGRDRPVVSVVIEGPNAIEGALVEIHSEVFGVLNRSVGGLEYILPHLQRELNEAICRGGAAVRELIPSLRERIDSELREVDEAFELSLDASKLQLRDAQELVEIIADPGTAHKDSRTLAKWAKELGMTTREHPDLTWEFKWTADELTRPLPELQRDGFVPGTFDRSRALADESQQFLGPGHSLVTALLADLGRSAEGRATVMAMELGPTYRKRLFALILGRCRLNEQLLEHVELPIGLRLRAQRQHWPEIRPALVELRPNDEPAVALVRDARLTALIRAPDSVPQSFQKIPPNVLGESFNTLTLWAAVDDAIPVALAHIRALREGIPEQAAQQLANELRPEIGFLMWKQRMGEEGEIVQQEIVARERLIDAVRSECIEVEAIAVIIGV